MDKSEGFTRFPNDIYESIFQIKLTASQLTALLYIIRKTHGYNKGNWGDNISISQMAKETGYTRRAMVKAIQFLESRRIILVAHAGSGRVNNFVVNDSHDWLNL